MIDIHYIAIAFLGFMILIDVVISIMDILHINVDENNAFDI